jgi:WD40 repeat protein
MRGAFSPDGSRILTASNDYSPDMRLWDGDGCLVEVLPFEKSCNPGTVAFGPAASRLLAWPSGRTLHVHDLDGRPVARLRTALDEAIRVFAFDGSGTRVAIGSYGSEVQVWSLEGKDGLLLTTLKGHTKEINSVQFSCSGKRLLTSSSDGTVREFVVDLEELVADAASRVPGTLTEEEIERYAVPRPLRFGPIRVP